MNKKKIFAVLCLLVLILGIGVVSAEDDSTLMISGETHTFDELSGGSVIYLNNDTWEGTSHPIQLTTETNVLKGDFDNDMGTLDGKGTTYILNVAPNSNLLVSNIIFLNGYNADGNGGAVYIGEGANVTFVNCKFIGNSAKNGGAIYGSNFTLVDCEFINNTATANGGAVYANEKATIMTVTFSGNSASKGGAIYASDAVEVKYSNFNNNIAQVSGGAIASNRNVTVISSIFNANLARNGGGGSINSKNLDVSHSVFSESNAVYGGAISALVDMNKMEIPTGYILDCMFIQNNATGGPGADIYYTGELTVSNSSFSSTDAQGGAHIFVPTEGILINDNNAFISNIDATNVNSNVVVNVENIWGSDDVRVYTYVPVGATGEVILALNTQKVETIALTSDKSKYVNEISNIIFGLNEVTGKYSGDENFVSGIQSEEFNKTHKRDITLNINAPAIDYGSDAVITITSSINGPFEVSIGGQTQTITLEKGKKELRCYNLSAGGYEIIVSYAGDATTNSMTASEMLLVNKIESTLNVDVVTTDVSVTLNVESNVENVIVYIDGNYYGELPIINGNGSELLELPYLGAIEGYYTINVITNDANFFVSEVSKEFSTEYRYILQISNVEFCTGAPVAITPEVHEEDERAGAGIEMIITIKGENYTQTVTRVTDSQGKTQPISLSALAPGIYNITGKFANQAQYGYHYTLSHATVIGLIEAEKDVVVDVGEWFEYSAKIVNQNNETQPNVPVVFTIDGKNYTTTSDSEGIATIRLKLNTTGEHNVTVTAVFKQTPSSDPEEHETTGVIEVVPPEMDSFTVTSSVTNNKATITANLGEDAQGTVIFNVNGVDHVVDIYNKMASLTLNNLENGQYRVVATLNSSQFKPATNSTMFRVDYTEKGIIIGANPIIMSYGTSNNPFVVRVVDEDFNPLANIDLVISINGTSQTLKTDGQGSVSVNTDNMDIGYYPVTVEFKGSTSYPATTVESYIEITPVLLTSMKLTTAVTLYDVEIIAVLNQNVTKGTVVFNVNGTEYTRNVVGDTASLNIEGLAKGNYTVLATFKSSSYPEIYNSTDFTIYGERADVEISASDLTMDYGEDKSLEIAVTDSEGVPLVGIDLVVKLGDQTFYGTTGLGGTASVSLSKANGGDFTAEISFAGNEDYMPNSTTAQVLINPIDMGSIEVNASVNYEHAVITVTFPNEVGSGEVVFDVDGEKYSVPITGNTASLDLINLGMGQHTVSVELDSPNYNAIEGTTTFDITQTRTPVIIAANNVTMKYGENKYLNAVLTDNNGNPISGATLSVKIGTAVTPYTTDADGKISIPLSQFSAGSYPVAIKFNGTETYAVGLKNVLITVNPNKMGSMNINTAVDGQNATITVTLSQEIGEGNITLNVNGVNKVIPVTGKTATVTLNNLSEGNYTVKATLNSPNFEATTSSASFEISLAKPLAITVSPTDVYYSSNFVIYVKDANGKAVTGVVFKVTLNGVTKSYRTSATGRITLSTSDLKVSDSSKSTPYDIRVVYDGTEYDHTSVDATINVLTTIVGDDLVKMYKNASGFVAKILDKNGKPVAQGTKVTLNINKGTYEREVDANGYVNFGINLVPGEYELTVTNPSTKQVSVFNVTILSNMVPLNFENEFTKYYRNATPFRLTLLDDQGKPLGAGVLLSMNINGVFYNKYTLEDGAVSFNINLLPGTYILTAIRDADGHQLMRSYTVNILSPIVGESISMTTSDRKQFKATILDGQGNPDVGNTVVLNINGRLYSREVTQANNGEVVLNINLPAGTYILTIYMDCRWAPNPAGGYFPFAKSFEVLIKDE